MGFAYHNHDFEFIDHGGENGYNIIMRETDPALVKLQMDLYWVMHSSKLSPSELFKPAAGTFRNVAYKRYGQNKPRLFRIG